MEQNIYTRSFQLTNHTLPHNFHKMQTINITLTFIYTVFISVADAIISTFSTKYHYRHAFSLTPTNSTSTVCFFNSFHITMRNAVWGPLSMSTRPSKSLYFKTLVLLQRLLHVFTHFCLISFTLFNTN